MYSWTILWYLWRLLTTYWQGCCDAHPSRLATFSIIPQQRGSCRLSVNEAPLGTRVALWLSACLEVYNLETVPAFEPNSSKGSRLRVPFLFCVSSIHDAPVPAIETQVENLRTNTAILNRPGTLCVLYPFNDQTYPGGLPLHSLPDNPCVSKNLGAAASWPLASYALKLAMTNGKHATNKAIKHG
jgi:hypothetical protein